MIDTNDSMNDSNLAPMILLLRNLKHRLRHVEARLLRQERHLQERLQQQGALQQRGREDILSFLHADQQRQEQLIDFIQQHQTKIVNGYHQMESIVLKQQQRIDMLLQHASNLQDPATADQPSTSSNTVIDTPSGSSDHVMIEYPDSSDDETKAYLG